MTSLSRLRVPANTQATMGANKKRSPVYMKNNQQKKPLRGGYCSLFNADNLLVDDGMDVQSPQVNHSPLASPSSNHKSDKLPNHPNVKRNLNFSGNTPQTTPSMDIEQPLVLRKRKYSDSTAPVNNNSNTNVNNNTPLPSDTPIIFDEDVFQFLDDISTQDSAGFAALLKACDSLAGSPVKTTPCPSPSASQPTPASSNPSNNNNTKIDDIQDFATPSPQTPPNNKNKNLDDSIIKSPMSSPPVAPVRYNKYSGMSKETIDAVMDFDKLMRSTENLLQTIQPPSSSVVENSWLGGPSKSLSPRKRPTISEIEKRIDRAISESIQVTDVKPGISNLEKIFTVYGHKYYTVVISATPSCSCPDNMSGRSGFHCKHILFVLVNILRVQRNDPCLFRRDLLNSELYAMFYPETSKPAPPKVTIPQTAKVVENEDGTMVLEPELEAILDSHKEVSTEPQLKKVKLVDERKGNVPGLLKDFKPAVYTPPKSKQREMADANPLIARNKLSMQEFLCRDCKKPFCRKGDRDNHELRMNHTRWRKGENRQLVTASSS